ncbi:MAG: hypothetical protein NC218_07200 [Acetobacter sp.]|nr:hypothetical protein [Acetobacter sp.]
MNKFYRYEISIQEEGEEKPNVTYGIVIATSLGDAADKVANGFTRQPDYDVIYVKTESLAPPEDDILILNKDLVDKIAEEVIW